MRALLRPALLVVTVSALLSCATTAPRAVVTVELLDSRAFLLKGAETETIPWAAPAVAAFAREEPVQTETVVTPALEGPREPSSGFEAALAAPIRPRTRQVFALADPAAPAAVKAPSRVSSAAPAARQAPTKTAPSAPGAAAAATSRAAAGQAGPAERTSSGAAAPGSPSDGATAGGPGASGTTGSAAAGTGSAASASGAQAAASSSPGDSFGRLREIFARQGDEVQVGLDGMGFLFLGFPDRPPQGDGMSFKGKENRNGKTWFTFKALKIGTYDLDFLQQQNATGRTAKETVRVHVVSDAEFTAAVSQKAVESPQGTASVEAGDPAFAGRLTSLGQYEAAVGELLKGYRDGNPALNDQIATLYMRMRSWDAAAKYFTKNLTPPGPLAERAIMGLVQVSVAQKDQQLLMSLLKQFLATKDPQAEEPLIQAVRMERDKAEIGVGMDLAEEYAARFPSGRWIDEAQFLLAQFLEADSPFRDIARARDTYSGVMTAHPESPYADPARERLRYIERHFYQVR